MIIPIGDVEQFFSNVGFTLETPAGEPYITFVRGTEMIFHGSIDGHLIESDFLIEDIRQWDNGLADSFSQWLDGFDTE